MANAAILLLLLLLLLLLPPWVGRGWVAARFGVTNVWGNSNPTFKHLNIVSTHTCALTVPAWVGRGTKGADQ